LISLPGVVCDETSQKARRPIFDTLNLGPKPIIKNYIENDKRHAWTTIGRNSLNFLPNDNFEIKLYPPIRFDANFPKKYESSEQLPTASLLRVSNKLSKKIFNDPDTPENNLEDAFFWDKVK